MAAIGSERRPGLSLRLRLTLLYGACFVVGSAAVLAITYLLVAQDTSNQTRQLRVGATKLQLPSPDGKAGKDRFSIERVRISRGREEVIVLVGPRSSATHRSVQQLVTEAPVYSTAQMSRIRAGALRMSRCMRAHGIDYPNLTVVGGDPRHGFTISIPRRAATHSPNFRAANIVCSRLLNRSIPGHGAANQVHASSVQRQFDVIVDRANGALTTQRSRSLGALLTWSAVALGVLAIISIVLGWLVAGRGLRPLRRMSARARRITEENLHERLSVETREDELGELATTFDGVLARLQRAFDAHKRFVANASHELRTPVTVERTLLEVALEDPETDAATLRRTCERVLASTKQQQQMIEALLTLARSQGGTDVDVPTDLAELAQDAIALRERRLDAVTVAGDLHPAPLHGDPALLERLIANLVDNSIAHNLDEDGWVTIETGHTDGCTWLRVSNSGPEIPQELIPELFEPFRRMEGERTVATTAGVGLGLSIVRAIADVHGATVDAGPVRGGGLRVEVRF